MPFYVPGYEEGTDPFADLSEEQLMALLGGGGSNTPFSTVSFGGNLYRVNKATGDIELAAEGPGPAPAAPRQPQYTVDERTGQVVAMTPGAQVGFAGIDPREKYQNELQQQGFSNQVNLGQLSLQQRAQVFNEAEAGLRRAIELSQMAEQGKISRAQLGESKANRGENARQANLQAAVSQWQTAMNLIPQMGQLSIQESERVQGILQNGGDFLARAFESRGGTSPLAKVTQADQINALGGTLQNLRNMVNQNTQGGVVSGQYNDTAGAIPNYEAPNLNAPSGGFAGQGGTPALPSLPQAPNFQVSPAPAVSSPAGEGGGGAPSGGFAAAAPTIMNREPEPAPAAAFAPPPQPTFDWGNPDEAMGAERGSFSQIAPPPTYTNNWGNLPGEPSIENQGPAIPMVGVPTKKGFNLPDLIRGAFTPSGGSGGALYRGYDQGGFTTEPMFLGNEKGAELFVNPTGAPIQVIPHDETQKMGFKKAAGYHSGTHMMPDGSMMSDKEMPGYDEGTSGAPIDPTRWLQMMQRMELQDQGGYGNVAASLFGGPSGGGGVNMGKGFSKKINPELVKKATEEFKASQLAKRIAMMGDETGGGSPGALFRGLYPENETAAHTRKLLESDLARLGPLTDPASPLYDAENMWANREAFNAAKADLDDLLREMGKIRKLIPGFATGTGEMQLPRPIINGANGFGGQVGRSVGPSVSPWGAPNPYKYNAYGGTSVDEGLLDEWQNGGVNPPPTAGTPTLGFKNVSQKELIETGRKNLPPGVEDVLYGGRTARPNTALESQAVPGRFLKTITARQLQSLTPEEIQALGTMANTEYNAPLPYVLGRTQAQYGPSQEMRRGFLRSSGL